VLFDEQEVLDRLDLVRDHRGPRAGGGHQTSESEASR
jgi:hypothetical protein